MARVVDTRVVDTCFEVMGFDLRNELRPAGPFSGIDVGMLGGKHRPLRCAGGVWPKWGGNESATDWPRAATKAATTILEKNVGCLGAYITIWPKFFFPNVSRKT